MANIFLDANIVIDLAENRKEVGREQFDNHTLFISPLSIHILNYLYKYQIPDEKFFTLRELFTIISLDQVVFENAIRGPTVDFEDNVQLHSAATVPTDFFLTSDKGLLNMRFFGKTRIVERVE